MSQTQSFPKPMWHLDKSRHFILLSQPYSQCLACQAKMLTTRKRQKVQQANLKEWCFYCSKEALQVLLGTHLLGWLSSWVVPWPNEGLTHLQAPMVLSGTLQGSLQLKNNLELPTLVLCKGMYKMTLEYSRTLYTIPILS